MPIELAEPVTEEWPPTAQEPVYWVKATFSFSLGVMVSRVGFTQGPAAIGVQLHDPTSPVGMGTHFSGRDYAERLAEHAASVLARRVGGQMTVTTQVIVDSDAQDAG
jgi:hypothetical protein